MNVPPLSQIPDHRTRAGRCLDCDDPIGPFGRHGYCDGCTAKIEALVERAKDREKLPGIDARPLARFRVLDCLEGDATQYHRALLDVLLICDATND